jgi:SAM-dependent methyltransferase
MSQSTEIFTKTVGNYKKYRPSYPKDIITLLIDKTILTPDSIIADLGSGTGIFTKLLLDQGNFVFGVEPNRAMRTTAEQDLTPYPNFQSVAATAETTTITEHSIDIITVATAFHWLDADKVKIEFQRILKSPGYVVLLWNVRDQTNSPLQRDYEELIEKYGLHYKDQYAHKFDIEGLKDFFSPYPMHAITFPYVQQLDWEGLKGRLLSTTYALQPHEANFTIMVQQLKDIYDKYENQGTVEFLYNTEVYYGCFS